MCLLKRLIQAPPPPTEEMIASQISPCGDVYATMISLDDGVNNHVTRVTQLLRENGWLPDNRVQSLLSEWFLRYLSPNP